MAMPNGQPPDVVGLLSELERTPQAFDFHVALRRLECAFRQYPRLGTAVRPGEEPVRLGQDPDVSFAPSELVAFDTSRDDVPPRLSVAFLGLFGPNGALPIHLTEYARDRLRNSGDATFARFIDVFHHRMLLLFHRAWAAAQPSAEHDRPEHDRFKEYAGALAGFGRSSRVYPGLLPEEIRWYYAGLFATANRSAEGLRNFLADYFGVQVRIQEFLGEWAVLPDGSRLCLNGSAETSALGRTSVIGKRVRLCQGRFRIIMGPLGRAAFGHFLPGGENLERLAALVRTYAGDELTWDVRLIPAEDATDQLRLGDDRRLGWNTRLGHRKAVRIEELIVDPSSRQTRRTVAQDDNS